MSAIFKKLLKEWKDDPQYSKFMEKNSKKIKAEYFFEIEEEI